MGNNLFLEGPIQTGKSTLIRELLGEHLKKCGGFTSQRLISTDGRTIGFRIGPAAVTELTAPVASMRPGAAPAMDPDEFSSRSSIPPLPEYLLTAPDGTVYTGVFKYFDRMGRTHKDQEIFDVLGTFYLTAAETKPLVLLDEIGGSELLSDPFRNALCNLLASDIPCLGVLKLAESAWHMQRAYGFDAPGEPGSEESSSSSDDQVRSVIPGTLSGAGKPDGMRIPGVQSAPSTRTPSIKTPSTQAPSMQAPSTKTLSIVGRNLKLRRQILEDFGGRILYYQRTESGDSPEESAVRSTLAQFIGGVFSD